VDPTYWQVLLLLHLPEQQSVLLTHVAFDGLHEMQPAMELYTHPIFA